MLEKTSVVSAERKLMILKELALRTWPFARPQGAEKERGNTGQERQNQASQWVAKSASGSEKPRQTWRLAGFIEMQRECLCKFYWWWNREPNYNRVSKRMGKVLSLLA
jgi:hypothetical protein